MAYYKFIDRFTDEVFDVKSMPKYKIMKHCISIFKRNGPKEGDAIMVVSPKKNKIIDIIGIGVGMRIFMLHESELPPSKIPHKQPRYEN